MTQSNLPTLAIRNEDPPSVADLETPTIVAMGGGLTGSLFALAASDAGFPVTLVAKRSANRPPLADDPRALALSKFSQQYLAGLDVWSSLANGTAPITRIDVTERHRIGASSLDADACGVDAFGYVTTHRDMARILNEHLEARVGRPNDGVTFIDPDHFDETQLAPALWVGADAANDMVRSRLGIDVEQRDYHQVAMGFRVRLAAPAPGLAVERFTADGPVALLPFADGWMGGIWTVRADHAPALLQATEQAFARTFQRTLGWRFGRVEALGERHGFALRSQLARGIIGARGVLIGGAASSVHPIGGQGFNLALRDVAALVHRLKVARDSGRDIGAPDVLEPFARIRWADHRRIRVATDSLNALFSNRSSALGAARGLGLLLFDLMPFAKRGLTRFAMGYVQR
ncbi:MAG: FAD-dependent monooxygenase [Pseudomonadota bacterium]